MLHEADGYDPVTADFLNLATNLGVDFSARANFPLKMNGKFAHASKLTTRSVARFRKSAVTQEGRKGSCTCHINISLLIFIFLTCESIVAAGN